MEFYCVIFVLICFIQTFRCEEDTQAAEPLGCSKNSDYIISYLLTKVDDLQTQLHSLQLELKDVKQHVLDDKQLMLQTSDATAANVLALEQEIRALNSRYNRDIKDFNASQILEIKQVKKKYNNDLLLMSTEIHKLSHDQGSTYVRWGKTTCGGNGTEKVYSGFTSGSPFDVQGGAASFLCLPQNPTWAKYFDGIQRIGGYVSGTEYKIGDAIRLSFPRSMSEQDAPCTVCRSPRPTAITIPGRTDCYDGWTMEYTGYLMTGHFSHKAATDYACVDSDPEAVYHGGASQDGKLLYFAEVKCGSLPCQEYPDGRELACVVCSK